MTQYKIMASQQIASQQKLLLSAQQYKELMIKGMQAQQKKDKQLALDCYNRMLAQNPKDTAALYNIAVMMLENQQFDNVFETCEHINKINPQNYNNWLLIAKCAYSSKQPHKVITAAKKLKKIDDSDYRAELFLGLGFGQLDEYKIAIEHFEKALRLHPDQQDVMAQMMSAHQKLFNYKKAIVCANRLIKMQRYLGEAHNMLALANVHNGECAKAMPHIKNALRYNPKSASANFNYAHCAFFLGQYNNISWRAYEFRFFMAKIRRFEDIPHWNGKDDLTNKNVVIYSEQGYGDTIQFARFLQLLPEGISNAIFECQTNLVKVMRSCPGKQIVIPRANKMPQKIIECIKKIDYAIPLLSIPYLLGIEENEIRELGKIKYLEPNIEKGDKITLPANISEQKAKIKKIGIVWNINVYSPSPQRCIDFDLVKSLLETPNCEFFIMHGNLNDKELAYVNSKPNLHYIYQGLHDFNHTAFALQYVDLLITIDTAIAHLAGAMHKKCWCMVPRKCDWRWGAKEQSIWYDHEHMKLYRQKKHGDWQTIVNQIIKDLKEYAII